MTAVPALTPVTTPPEAVTVAVPVLPLLHAPPPDASLRSVVRPMQMLAVPVMGSGTGFTVSVL
jgi:hypothetical protein